MRSAIWRENIVGKRLHHFYKRVVVLDSDFHHRIFDLLLYIKNTLTHYILTDVEMLYVALNTAFKIKSLALFGSFVTYFYIYTLGQIRLMAQVIHHPLIIKFYRLFKNSWIRIEGNRCTRCPICCTNLFKGRDRCTTLKFNTVELAFLNHLSNEFC